MTDAASYNVRAERHSAEGHTVVFHILCDVHVLSGIHSKVFSLGARTISGMTKLRLFLQGTGQMHKFRRALRVVLRDRLRLVYTRPSEEAIAFKEAVLQQLCGSDIGKAHLRTVLSRCASGDWRQTDCFEFWAMPGQNKRDVLRFLFRHLVPALAGRRPATFPQHRWTGAEHSLRDVGLLAAVHNLLEPVYEEYLRANFGGAAAAAPAAAAVGPSQLQLAVYQGLASGADIKTVAINSSDEASRHHRVWPSSG